MYNWNIKTSAGVKIHHDNAVDRSSDFIPYSILPTSFDATFQAAK